MRRAEAILPDDPTLKQIHHGISVPTTFSTNPPGAEVWATGYDSGGQRLGASRHNAVHLQGTAVGPLSLPHCEARIPDRIGLGRSPWRDPAAIRSRCRGRPPAGDGARSRRRVRIPGLNTAKLSAFLIDRYEITNRQFKEFVDRGGYREAGVLERGLCPKRPQTLLGRGHAIVCRSHGPAGSFHLGTRRIPAGSR